MNKEVSFPISKLLKEKGFKEECNGYWYESNIQGKQSLNITYPQTRFKHWYRDEILAPTIAEVVMWLYEKHGIWISVFSTDDISMFSYKISSKQGHNYSPNFNSPMEAHEAAINYTLKNLL
jgi:hypothetical protein